MTSAERSKAVVLLVLMHCLLLPQRFCWGFMFDPCFVVHYNCCDVLLSVVTILSETSKPPLNIFSYIFIYMIHTWLQFTLNMDKSIKQNLSKFHFHKLKVTCSIDRLIKALSHFIFTQTLPFELIASNRVFQGPKVKNTNLMVL